MPQLRQSLFFSQISAAGKLKEALLAGWAEWSSLLIFFNSFPCSFCCCSNSFAQEGGSSAVTGVCSVSLPMTWPNSRVAINYEVIRLGSYCTALKCCTARELVLECLLLLDMISKIGKNLGLRDTKRFIWQKTQKVSNCGWNKNICLPKVTWPFPKSQWCVRKTFSTYFASLSQWKN